MQRTAIYHKRAPPKDILTLLAERLKLKCDICGIDVSSKDLDMVIDSFLYPINFTRRDKQVCNFCYEAELRYQAEAYIKYMLKEIRQK